MINNQSLKSFKQSIQIALAATGMSVFLSQFMGWITLTDLNWWEVAATFASFSCTWMCVKQTRWNYPMAIVSVLLLSYVFWSAGLLASAALNIYLIPTVIYGYFIWGQDKQTKPVQHVELRVLPVYLAFTAAAYFGAYFIVDYFGGNLAPLDSWLLIGSIFAQFLLDRKRIETWIIWLSVNTVSVYVYFESGLYLLAIQFALFWLNSLYGYYSWNRSMKENMNDV